MASKKSKPKFVVKMPKTGSGKKLKCSNCGRTSTILNFSPTSGYKCNYCGSALST